MTVLECHFHCNLDGPWNSSASSPYSIAPCARNSSDGRDRTMVPAQRCHRNRTPQPATISARLAIMNEMKICHQIPPQSPTLLVFHEPPELSLPRMHIFADHYQSNGSALKILHQPRLSQLVPVPVWEVRVHPCSRAHTELQSSGRIASNLRIAASPRGHRAPGTPPLFQKASFDANLFRGVIPIAFHSTSLAS